MVRIRKHIIFIFASLTLILLTAGSARADTPAQLDPFWVLLHERAVLDDLKLSPTQQTAYRALLDDLDLRFFPLRNKSGHAAKEGQAQLVAEARTKLPKILQSTQQVRLDMLLARRLGFDVLLQDDFAKKMKLTAAQLPQIKAAVETAQSELTKLREGAKDKPAESLNKQAEAIQTTQRDAISAILTNAQKLKWRELVAVDFDFNKLGKTHYQPPELIGDQSAWRNSPPLTIGGLKGKVVVVHYFAFGCINCVHNYPIYQKWHREMASKGVTLVGIHTPETEGERSIASLEGKLKSDDLQFPVLIDSDKANWNAWGNNVWPAVYILDKQGDLRYYWPGELNWEGTEGERIARGWIDQLLAE